ncbi:MAG TPA: hypothetical protein VF002_05475 [Gaiellaceae bacterium]
MGAYAQITESNPGLNCTDIGVYETGQTVRELLASTGGHYVEVGWAKLWCAAGSACQRAFYEHQVGFHTDYQTSHQFSCLNPGTRSAWQMYWNTASYWEGDLQCYSSGSWYLVDYHYDPTQSGYSDNEGFDLPDANGVANNMAETHQSLMWLDTGYVWHATSGSIYPDGVGCRLQKGSYWRGNWLSGGNSFNIVSSGGEPC